MHLALAIFQGLGLAAAAGLRPFLPALLAGALASANAGVDFDHTHYAFLEAPWFLVVMLLALAATVALGRVRPRLLALDAPLGAALAGVGIGLGALLFAGSLADLNEPSWPGLVGGAAAAALSQASTAPILRGAAARLDQAARVALPFFAELAALVLAGLSVLIPPISVVAVLALLVLLVRVRRREDGKYAGLRILR